MKRDTAVTGVTEVQAGRGPARDSVLLGKYRVESTLGFGGMGLVIKAHNLAIDEHVAIKLLREDIHVDQANIQRFLREAQNAVKLKSEHVARIHDVGTLDDGRPYMIMELLDGLDLGRLLVDVSRIDRERAVDLVLQACDAIAEAHALGIVHRDIKPTNLFVTRRRDGSDLLKVLDFGISKARVGPEMSLTQTSSMLGTPAYMSPEQMRSARVVDPRSDIWSLGTVLYELVEGQPPFDAENFAELCVMVATEHYAPLRFAPELGPIIDRCLAKQVEHRFQDVADLALALGPYSSDPERARRQVGRIWRVLGRRRADGSDPTPLPRFSSTSDVISSPSNPILPRLPAPTMPALRTPRPWKLIAALFVLFGGGIAAGIWVMGSGTEVPAASRQPEEVGSGRVMTVEPVDADVQVAPDAAEGPLEGSAAASATPIRKPPVRKPPVRKPPVRKPAGSGSAEVKAKCDPFDNPKGCK